MSRSKALFKLSPLLRIVQAQASQRRLQAIFLQSFFTKNALHSNLADPVVINAKVADPPENKAGKPGYILNEYDTAFFETFPDKLRRKGAFGSMKFEEKNKFNIYTFNYMLNVYSREPTLYRMEAEKLFQDLILGKYDAKPTAQTYTMMMLLYSKTGLYPEAEVVYAQMLADSNIQLEPLCFDVLNQAYVRGKASQEKMEKVIREMLQYNVQPTITTYALLIEGCVHRQDEQRVQGYLQRLSELGMEPDLRIYTSLLRLADLGNRPHLDIIALYRKMLRAGIAPNAAVFTTLFQACLRCNSRDTALSLFDEMIKLKAEPTTFILKLLGLSGLEVLNRVADLAGEVSPKLYNALLTQACKANDFNMAFKITTHMHKNGHEPDVYSYGILMEAYVKMANYDKAFQLFGEMKLKGIQPDAHIYRALIEGLYGTADMERALSLVKEAEEDGVGNLFIYNTILGFCARTKDLKQAQSIFRTMKQRSVHPDTRSYNTLLSLMTSYANFVDAWDTYLEMSSKGAAPDRITYDIMLRLCTDQMDHVKTLRLFDDMKSSKACFPTSVDCSNVMRLLAVLNRKPMAFEVWLGFIASPRADIQDASLSLFLNLCQNAKRPKLAISSFDVLKSRVTTNQILPLKLHPATYLLYLRILAAGGHFATFEAAFNDAKPIFGVQLLRGHLETLRGFFAQNPDLCKAFNDMIQTLPAGVF
ncbi:hypothetical protein DSO57_1032191 [Entomophthora muscae]|uniref:Uncharacterized protein n=1 Tax=Entomophthora muscae TaxID=34485 RepID=A0ACC2RRG9_9FUNG|nr:hypothetical protein DSO57_1032191 [Entomophthora muscae]